MKKILSLLTLLLLLSNISLKAQDTLAIKELNSSDARRVMKLLVEADTTANIALRLRFLIEALGIAEKHPEPNQIFDLNKKNRRYLC